MNNGIYNNKRILQDSIVRLMKDLSQPLPGIKKYGFGIEPKLLKIDLGDTVLTFSMIGHGDAAYGLIGDMFWNEDSKFGFVFLANGADWGYHHNK